MNVLTIFEQRIGAIFETGAPGERVPFSFKRLAKRAVREMEDETFVIDGVDTAPALYTILVSSKDDFLMRPMYVAITNEISQLIEAQAKKRGYTFVGKPLVRFMVDPALRGGKFSVFAENIDPRTLARLRDEENAYLGVTPPREIIMEQGFVPEPVPVHEEEPAPIAQEVAFMGENLAPSEDMMEAPGVDLEPEQQFEPAAMSGFDQDLEPVDMPAPEPVPAVIPAEDLSVVPVIPDIDEDFVSDLERFDLDTDEAEEVATPNRQDALAGVPDFLQNVSESFVDEPVVDTPDPFSVAADVEASPTCTIRDIESGRTQVITSDYTIIGRGQTPGGIVVRDPNASRRHAELVYQNGQWIVRDLRSTNGTLVNDIDVPEAVLHDGDVLTIGLTNLEFRVNMQ